MSDCLCTQCRQDCSSWDFTTIVGDVVERYCCPCVNDALRFRREHTQPALTLDQVVAKAKADGLKRLRVGDVEVELHPPASPPPAAAPDLDPKVVADLLAKKEDPDEILFWSAGGAGRTDKDGNPVAPPLTGEDADASR